MGLLLSRALPGSHLFSSSVSLFDLEARFFAPTHTFPMLSRAGAVKVGRRADLDTRSINARPYLDSPEHGSTLAVVG
jgi:hypothetical protein